MLASLFEDFIVRWCKIDDRASGLPKNVDNDLRSFGVLPAQRQENERDLPAGELRISLAQYVRVCAKKLLDFAPSDLDQPGWR